MRNLAAGMLCVLTTCLGAVAQENVERFERNLRQIQRDTQEQIDRDVPLNQRALVDYGGYLTLGYLSFDDSNHHNHGLTEYELVGYGRLNLDGAHEFYARGRTDYRSYNRGDNISGQGDRLEGRVEEVWYNFDLQRFAATRGGTKIDTDVMLKAGRQFVDWGSGLTLNQYVDGLTSEIRTRALTLDFLAGVTVKETVDFDISRPHFFDDTHRGYFGGRVTIPIARHQPYAFILFQQDFNRDEPADAHVIPTHYDYNSYYAGVGSNGALSDRFTYGTEFCFEGGHGLSNSYDPTNSQPISQHSDRIESWAADLQLNYFPNDRYRSRFTLSGIVASGDSDRVNSSGTFGGNRPGTVDHAFNSLGVLYAGLAFTPPVSNLMVLRAGASTYPIPQATVFKQLQVGADLFVFGKTRSAAPIDEPTGSSRYLGIEPDLLVNWQVMEDVTVAIRYGIFFPGDAIPTGDQYHIRQFLYAAVTYAF